MLKGGTVRNRDHGAMNFFLNYRKIALKQLLLQCCFGMTKQFLIAKLCCLNRNSEYPTQVFWRTHDLAAHQFLRYDRRNQETGSKGVCLRFFCRSIAGVSTADMSDLVGDRPSFSGRAKDEIVVKDEIERPLLQNNAVLGGFRHEIFRRQSNAAGIVLDGIDQNGAVAIKMKRVRPDGSDVLAQQKFGGKLLGAGKI